MYDPQFKPGMYICNGVTITSRGCPNNCSFCLVPKREGKLKEIEIKPGNILQDNNLLACSDKHINNVFSMLRYQKQIEFKGGLEAYRITDKIGEMLNSLYYTTKKGRKISRVKSIWLACDTKNAIKLLSKAINILNKNGFDQSKIYCYVLIGDDYEENLNRLISVYKTGAMPFAQLYRPDNQEVVYSKKWRSLQRTWSRPAATKAEYKRIVS